MRRIFSTVFGAQDPALTVGSLAITATGLPGDRAQAGDYALGSEALLLPARQQPVFGERAADRGALRRVRGRAACPVRRLSRGGAPGRRPAPGRRRLSAGRWGRHRSSASSRWSGMVGATVGIVPVGGGGSGLRGRRPTARPAPPITTRNNGQPTRDPRPAARVRRARERPAGSRSRYRPDPVHDQRRRRRRARSPPPADTASNRTALRQRRCGGRLRAGPTATEVTDETAA